MRKWIEHNVIDYRVVLLKTEHACAGRSCFPLTRILLEHAACRHMCEQKASRHMNWCALTTKPAKSSNNGAHPGPFHHQEDHSFTGNKVDEVLQKRQEGQELTGDCVETTGTRRLPHRHSCCMNPQDRHVIQHAGVSLMFCCCLFLTNMMCIDYEKNIFSSAVVKLVQF